MAYKRILTIQDISCVGQCSLTVALPILSASGHETCILPSAVLSTHTGGFKGNTFRDLTEDFTAIEKHWIKENIDFDAFYTGYLGSIGQMDLVANIVNGPLSKPNSIFVVDPVLGDNGVLYRGFDKYVVNAMRQLIKRADIIIPNITEACQLTESEYRQRYDKEYIRTIVRRVFSIIGHDKTIVLTGVGFSKNETGVGIFTEHEGTHYSHEKFDRNVSGTGDLYSSAFLGALLNGISTTEAAIIAANFIKMVIKNTIKKPAHWYGVMFEPLIGEYIKMIKQAASVEAN